jgi:hypothetical protein
MTKEVEIPVLRPSRVTMLRRHSPHPKQTRVDRAFVQGLLRAVGAAQDLPQWR